MSRATAGPNVRVVIVRDFCHWPADVEKAVTIPADASHRPNIVWDGQCTKDSTIHRRFHNVNGSEKRGGRGPAESDDKPREDRKKGGTETKETQGKLESDRNRTIEAMQ